MSRNLDLTLTALAPTLWGSTYLVTTELLPQGYPLTAAMLRALPAGVLLLILTRKLPGGIWIVRSLILGALNFSLFWWLLFIAAYRLPGGVAATVGAIQPLVVLLLCRALLDQPVTRLALLAGFGGILGVALITLVGELSLDRIGLLAALGGAVSMALGTVLVRKWQPPVSALSFTAWQLLAGGLLLLPAALWLEPPLPVMSTEHLIGFSYLGLFGGALTYFLWFRGIARLNPSTVTPLALLSPISAVFLGWILLQQNLHAIQMTGIALVLFSVWLGQHSQLKAARP